MSFLLARVSTVRQHDVKDCVTSRMTWQHFAEHPFRFSSSVPLAEGREGARFGSEHPWRHGLREGQVKATAGRGKCKLRELQVEGTGDFGRREPCRRPLQTAETVVPRATCMLSILSGGPDFVPGARDQDGWRAGWPNYRPEYSQGTNV